MDQNADIWKHCLEYAALSDLGMRRGNNQDSMAVLVASSQDAFRQRGHLFIVADGMGAHAAGELASKMAVDAISLVYHKINGCAAPEALRQALVAANQQIHGRGQASLDFRGMGTTASTLVILPEGAVVAHVGDSRVYRLRGQRLDQLTFDHSLVWEMSVANGIPDDEVPDYVPRNIITRSLGPNDEVAVDLEGPFPLESGDTFLLCSDGLSGVTRDDEIGVILGCMPPEDAARSLVDLANLRGGPDNITVIIVRVTGPQEARPVVAEAVAPRPRPRRAVHWLVWLLLVVFALATLGTAVVGEYAMAMVGLVCTLLTGAVVLARRYGHDERAHEFDGQPLGKGPYRSHNCEPNGEFVERLSRVVQQLRDEAARNDWAIDWQHFNQIHSEANEAAATYRHRQAIRLYCHAMSFMMAQLRSE